MADLIDQFIGHYHILEQIGEGGTAIVYKAYDTHLERDVAIKIIRTDLFGEAMLETVLKRFEREAKALAKISHPNIISVIDYGKHEGFPYLVMTYLPGGTLTTKLGQPIPWGEAVRLLLPVARALAYAHGLGVIHRDVKPNNILIARSGDPMLSDFGIAKMLDVNNSQTLTGSGVGIGTPDYIAPEQALGYAIDARVDVYALGVVFYEMVTGKKPFTADTPMAVVIKCISAPLPPPTQYVPDLSEAVEYLLLKALARKPEDRYADMNVLIAALENLVAEQTFDTNIAQKRKDTDTFSGRTQPERAAHVLADNESAGQAAQQQDECEVRNAENLRKPILASQDNRTVPLTDQDSLPAKEPGKLFFRAQVISENLEPFGADPQAPAADTLLETLKALRARQPEFDPKDYRIYIASPLTDKSNPSADRPPKLIGDDKSALQDVLNDGDFVFFIKSTGQPKKLEIWIRDQKILVFDKPKGLIGRRDIKNGINPDIDLAPYLAENVLKISRKQAWLVETDHGWAICLDENARSPVYLNGETQLEPGKSYEILNDTRLGFGGSLNQSYLYITLRLAK